MARPPPPPPPRKLLFPPTTVLPHRTQSPQGLHVDPTAITHDTLTQTQYRHPRILIYNTLQNAQSDCPCPTASRLSGSLLYGSLDFEYPRAQLAGEKRNLGPAKNLPWRCSIAQRALGELGLGVSARCSDDEGGGHWATLIPLR